MCEVIGRFAVKETKGLAVKSNKKRLYISCKAKLIQK